MGNLCSRKRKPMANYYLPEGIITDIISRLPFDTVLDCKLVCRNWRALISHPSFSQMHLRRSLQLLDGNEVDDHNDCCSHYFRTAAAAAAKVTFVSEKESQLHFVEYDDENEDHDSHKKIKKINLPHNDCCDLYLALLSSCNGLICLVSQDYTSSDVYICNPVIREYINLPTLFTGEYKARFSEGFGYSPKTNEYKFVRIYYKNYYNLSPMGLVYVYTLGSGSGWRNVEEINYKFPIFSPGVFANGALHWTKEGDRKIVSFDLVDEKFRLLPSPPCSGDYLLRVLGGWVCAVVYEGDGNDTMVVWSLKKKKKEKGTNYEKGDQSLSWSLEFTIPGVGNPSANNHYVPFFLSKSGEVLMLDGRRRLCCFNLITASVETIVDCIPHSPFCDTILHMNSFVSLKSLGEDAKILGSAEEVTDDLT